MLENRVFMTTDRVAAMCEYLALIQRDSHFVYSSGRHGSDYFDKDKLNQNPVFLDRVARAIAERWAGYGIDVVVAPTLGATALGNYVALHLSTQHHVVRALNAEPMYVPHEGKDLLTVMPGRVVKRGAEFLPGKRVLVVEDVITTGKAARETLDAVLAARGLAFGVACICNRSSLSGDMLFGPNVIFNPLLNIPMRDWIEEDCPLCKANIEVRVDLGHGHYFLMRQASHKLHKPSLSKGAALVREERL